MRSAIPIPTGPTGLVIPPGSLRLNPEGAEAHRRRRPLVVYTQPPPNGTA